MHRRSLPDRCGILLVLQACAKILRITCVFNLRRCYALSETIVLTVHLCMYAVRNSDISDTGCPMWTHLKWRILTHIYSSYAILLIAKQKFQWNPKMMTFDFSGLQNICGPAKFHLQPCQTYVWPSKWVIIIDKTTSLWLHYWAAASLKS